MRLPYFLSVAVAALMGIQAMLGLALPEAYRDVDWIRATWFGNDWITLVLGVPLLAASLLLTQRGSTRGLLLWLGMLGYAAYNYAFYLFGAALNAFLPLYSVLIVLAAVTLILALSQIDAVSIAAAFRQKTPVRLIGGYLAFVATSLTLVWLGMWAAHIFAGRPTPVEPEAFKVVAALDFTMLVPVMGCGGVLLWRRTAWGYVIASMAAILGFLYLLVLTVNSFVAIQRGFEEAPGQLPIWGPLTLATATAAALLLMNVHTGQAAKRGSDGEPQ